MMNDDDPGLLGPYFSKLPTELVLDIALTLSSSSQNSYANVLLVCRTLHDLCRVACLKVVPVVIQTSKKSALFAKYLETKRDVAPLVRRLWIDGDHHDIISQCTNLVSLACNGYNLITITSSKIFNHTQLIDLTIMGLFDFWSPFVKSENGRTLCEQLQKLWLLDRLSLHWIEKDWWSSMRELYYWSTEGQSTHTHFKNEVILLKALPKLERLGVITYSPSPLVFQHLKMINDARLEVIPWRNRAEVSIWISQRL